MKKGCSRVFLIGLGIVIVLAVVWSLMNFSGAPGEGEAIIPISPETTVVEGPINHDGDVDHVAYLNQLHGKDVTPENNAAVDFLKLIGPKCITPELRDPLFKRMGIESLPEGDDYFQDFYTELHELEKRDEIDDRQRRILEMQIEYAMANPWSPAEVPDVATWFETNAEGVERIRRAVDKPYFFVPMVDDSPRPMMIGILLPLVQESRAFARVLHANVMRNLRLGDAEACFADTRAMRNLARLVAQGPTLIEQLVGIAIDGIAANDEFQIARSGIASRTQLKEYRDQLASRTRVTDMHNRVDVTERMMFINSLTVLAREGSSATPDLTGQGPREGTWFDSLYDHLARDSTDWGEAARVGNHWFDRFATAIKEESYPKRRVALDALENELKLEANSIGGWTIFTALIGGRRAKGNLTGRILASLLLPAVTSATHAETRTIATDRMMQIVFSLEIYKVDNGNYPESLKELVPDYLEGVPIDPFWEKPFPYRTAEDSYSLYTIGPNMVDDGGNGYEAGGDDYELTSESESWEAFQLRQLEDVEVTSGTFITEEGQLWTNKEQNDAEDETNERETSDNENRAETSPAETEETSPAETELNANDDN